MHALDGSTRRRRRGIKTPPLSRIYEPLHKAVEKNHGPFVNAEQDPGDPLPGDRAANFE